MAKKNTPKIPVPAGKAEAEKLLGEIGNLLREAHGFQDELNAEIAAAERRYGALAAARIEKARARFTALKKWAEKFRGENAYFKKVLKSIQFATGELSWRVTPPRVTVHDEAAAIAAIGKLGKGELFIRTVTTTSLNKEALGDKGHREIALQIAGITITQQEEFTARPTDVPADRALTSKRKLALSTADVESAPAADGKTAA